MELLSSDLLWNKITDIVSSVWIAQWLPPCEIPENSILFEKLFDMRRFYWSAIVQVQLYFFLSCNHMDDL